MQVCEGNTRAKDNQLSLDITFCCALSAGISHFDMSSRRKKPDARALFKQAKRRKGENATPGSSASVVGAAAGVGVGLGAGAGAVAGATSKYQGKRKSEVRGEVKM